MRCESKKDEDRFYLITQVHDFLGDLNLEEASNFLKLNYTQFYKDYYNIDFQNDTDWKKYLLLLYVDEIMVYFENSENKQTVYLRPFTDHFLAQVQNHFWIVLVSKFSLDYLHLIEREINKLHIKPDQIISLKDN